MSIIASILLGGLIARYIRDLQAENMELRKFIAERHDWPPVLLPIQKAPTVRSTEL